MIKKTAAILIIDDDEDVLITAKMILRNHFKEILTASSPKQLESLLQKQEVNIIVLDMNFKAGATSGNEGLFWLGRIKSINPQIDVIMNTAYGDIQLAVECMKQGAIDFLVKPWEKEKLLATVNTVYQLQQAEKKVNKLEESRLVLNNDIEKDLGEMIGRSQAIKDVFRTIKKVAQTDANILILGENGTGKELVARAIHKYSNRRNNDFVKVDLGALSGSLFESELFGHVKGAFTDAKSDRAGRIEVADEGTLFLDEIGNITLAHQAKLLTVLQNREVTRVGATKPTRIDVRLISATNKHIPEMVPSEIFRQDLLYRINTVEINLPPLRDRDGDIELLANHFLEAYAQKYEKPSLTIHNNTLGKLEEYDWPGNVRELQHAVERAVIMSDGKSIQPEDLLVKPSQKKKVNNDSLKVEDLEKQAILQAIEKYKGNLTRAAGELGMGRSTLYRKMERYNMN